MKKIISAALILSMATAYAIMPISVGAAGETETITYNYNLEDNVYKKTSDHTREMEKLDRGLVAIKTNSGVYLSWRLFDSEDKVYGSSDKNVTFNVYRDGVKINTDPVDATSYTDTDTAASVTAKYAIVPSYAASVNSIEKSADNAVTVNTIEDGFMAYAAKYNEGKLEKVWAQPAGVGTSTKTLDFTPDKVFLWDGMKDVNGTGVIGETPIALTAGTGVGYFDIPIVKPASETIISPSGETVGTFNFSPTDCSTGDLDGDGEYEIVVKWVSSERDVGSPGDGLDSLSGTVRFAAYKLNGKKLWQNDINLGKNVYSSAHTVQFLVYDFNGDGKAEMMCQTSLGSTDASGAYVSHAAKTDTAIAAYTDEQNASAEFRSDWGPVKTGNEFLTVFNGETGEAIDTINFPTARGTLTDWGDDSGNRSNRFVASVAYLDGEKPYAVYLRGYYFGKNNRQRCGISGTSFDGEKLSVDYQFDTKSGQPGYYNGAGMYVGQGNHNCTVADVDNDGKDEFITGALCMEVKDDNTFKPRWCTFKEHGDALHIGDYDPTHKGFEFFTVHEDGGGVNSLSGTNVTLDFGMSVIDADTGEMIKHWSSGSDNGRGIMANIGAGGYYQVTSANAGTYRSDGGSNFTAGNYGMSQNFRIFWDGDLYDELLDGTDVTDWNGNGMSRIFRADGCTKINGTKSNPALQADLFGDWREELVYPTTDGNKLRVFMTTTPTDYKIKTLMHDPVYRSGVAAEQTAYNQPPHVGFYMGSEMFDAPVSSISITNEPSKKTYVIGEKLDLAGLKVTATLSDGTSKEVASYSVSEFDSSEPGEKTITVTYKGQTASFTVNVKKVTEIKITSEPTNTNVYQGSSLDTKGLVVTATYDDGSTGEVTDYTLEYNTSTVGSATVTVKYFDCEATFDITVIESSVSAINKEYVTNSTTSTKEDIPIGEYRGNFTLEHKIKINSMPASGNGNKNSTVGFFMRFMCPAPTGGSEGVGGGWYFNVAQNSTTDASVYWKSSGNSAQDAIRITNSTLKVDETYTFTYEFTDVGTGSGAHVNLTIKDSEGKVVGTGSNLGLRNLTESQPHLTMPMTKIEIYNQANSNSTASVTISDATIIVD